MTEESAPGLQDHHTVYPRQIRDDAQSADFLAISAPTEGSLDLSCRLNLAVGMFPCRPVDVSVLYEEISGRGGSVRTLSSLLLVLLCQPSAGRATAL